MSQGQGGGVVDTKDTLEDAIEFCLIREGQGSFAIEQPDGTWYKWKK